MKKLLLTLLTIGSLFLCTLGYTRVLEVNDIVEPQDLNSNIQDQNTNFSFEECMFSDAPSDDGEQYVRPIYWTINFHDGTSADLYMANLSLGPWGSKTMEDCLGRDERRIGMNVIRAGQKNFNIASEAELIRDLFMHKDDVFYSSGIGTCYQKVLKVTARNTFSGFTFAPHPLTGQEATRFTIHKITTICPASGAIIE